MANKKWLTDRPMTILDAIIATKRDELAAAQAAVPHAEMERRALAEAPPRDFAGALRGPGLAVIAEIKRASPSAGAHGHQ